MCALLDQREVCAWSYRMRVEVVVDGRMESVAVSRLNVVESRVCGLVACAVVVSLMCALAWWSLEFGAAQAVVCRRCLY